MPAIAVTSANTNRIDRSARVVVRTSTGILYIIVHDDTNDGIEVWKGNSVNPISFSEQDSANNPQSAGRYISPSGAIDSSNIIHIAYYDLNGKSSALRYVIFNTSTDTFSGDVSVKDIGSGNPAEVGTAISIDSNNIPHIVWTDVNKSAGVDYDTVYYVNKIGGVWNTQVEVEGVTANKLCRFGDLTIDKDNIPEISYTNNIDDQVTAALGNANNATSFSLFDVDSSVTDFFKGSIAIEPSGNTHVAYLQRTFGVNDIVRVEIREHIYGNAWTTWETIQVIDTDIGPGEATVNMSISLVIPDTRRYIFVEELDTNDIIFYRSSDSTWINQKLETGTYNHVNTKWAFNNNNQKLDRIDYVFTDETVSPDILWNEVFLIIPQNRISQPTSANFNTIVSV
ncbi:MAG: hypothetical protein AABY07_08645 [Nanoarchaeota archaeon]